MSARLQSAAVSTFIERVSLTNYKSIALCDVTLRPLTVVVGRNGSGKSNFIDSLHFVADALETTLEYAIRKRGGIRALIHRRGEQRMAIRLAFKMRGARSADYFLRLERGRVAIEELTIETNKGVSLAGYLRRGTNLEAKVAGTILKPVPSVHHDRLALVALSGNDAFREAYDALAAMRFYRLNPDAMREPQDFDEGEVLLENGSNIPSVWRRLERSNPKVTKRLTSYLTAIVPEISKVHRFRLGMKETLHFHQARVGKSELTFAASSMSDGTLRALGALVAARQGNGAHPVATLIAIEEPETALHPGAVAALMDALHEASATTQIIVTSHSPDVLDHVDIQSDALLVTESREGASVVAEVDEASREAIRRHLYTPGDLLRMDQLQPATESE